MDCLHHLFRVVICNGFEVTNLNLLVPKLVYLILHRFVVYLLRMCFMICKKPSLKPPATELGKHLGFTQRKCFSV